MVVEIMYVLRRVLIYVMVMKQFRFEPFVRFTYDSELSVLE